MLKQIKPTVIVPERVESPQCCVSVEPPTHAKMWLRERYHRLRPKYDPDRCQRPSTLEINGKYYCRLHAGQLAIEMWIVGDLVESK